MSGVVEVRTALISLPVALALVIRRGVRAGDDIMSLKKHHNNKQPGHLLKTAAYVLA